MTYLDTEELAILAAKPGLYQASSVFSFMQKLYTQLRAHLAVWPPGPPAGAKSRFAFRVIAKGVWLVGLGDGLELHIS